MQVEDILLEDIHIDEGNFNSRDPIKDRDLLTLCKSIEQNGLMSPVIVSPYTKKRKLYFLRAGHRRFKAVRMLDWKTIPAIVNEELQDDVAARFFNLEENLQRENLTILEEARAIKKLRHHYSMSENALADRLNKSRTWVQVRLMLLDLPKNLQQEAAQGFINQDQIRDLHVLLKKKGKQECLDAAKRAIKARKRGHSISLKMQNNQPYKERYRGKKEIFSMMEHVRHNFGNGIITRVLAWAAGEISDAALFESLRKYAVEKDIQYIIPEGYILENE